MFSVVVMSKFYRPFPQVTTTLCASSYVYILPSNTPLLKNHHPRHNFAKADWESICNFLDDTDWHVVFSDCYTADDLWNAFISVVQQAINMGAPRKEQGGGSPDPLDFDLNFSHIITVAPRVEVQMHFWKGAKYAGSVGHPMTKMRSASGGLRPLTRGSAPGPRWGLCPRPPL